jgi:hypothetical protein
LTFSALGKAVSMYDTKWASRRNKTAKYNHAFEVTNVYLGGYWEDGGYNWFSGL